MDEGLTIYENIRKASTSVHSIDMPQDFWVGLLLKSIIRRQEKVVDLLGTLYRDVLVDWEWLDESTLSANLRLADIEVQGVSNFP